MYIDCGFYDGDMDSEEISCYKEKLVKCRKPHKCNCCEKDILVGDYALLVNLDSWMDMPCPVIPVQSVLNHD